VLPTEPRGAGCFLDAGCRLDRVAPWERRAARQATILDGTQPRGSTVSHSGNVVPLSAA